MGGCGEAGVKDHRRGAGSRGGGCSAFTPEQCQQRQEPKTRARDEAGSGQQVPEGGAAAAFSEEMGFTAWALDTEGSEGGRPEAAAGPIP